MQRKMTHSPSEATEPLLSLLALVTRVRQQKRSDKSRDKVFALHAPEVSCIGKGKSARHAGRRLRCRATIFCGTLNLVWRVPTMQTPFK